VREIDNHFEGVMNRFIRRAHFLVLAGLLFVSPAPLAQAQHEGHTMPSTSKPKPVKKPAKKAVKKAPPKTPAEQAPPSNTSNTDQAAPANAPAPSDSSNSSQAPNPQTDSMPSPKQSDSTPTSPTTDPPHDHSKMSAAPDETTTPAPTTDPHAAHKPMTTVEGIPTSDSLMTMSEEKMDIRVGASKNNSIAMGQMGSGTSWQPATTPMYMWYKSSGKWLLFFHGDLKMGVNAQGGPRGVAKFESQNWFMPMAFRRVGAGTLQLRGMFSAEPFTFPPGGSPQLFQTGEAYRGQPIVDAQHPHDLFMELSGNYTLPIGERATWFAYLGFPGEPALGPTAFMHRMSASENPSAPLTHHLQDSSHISFGVFTTGFTYRWFKIEGSVFNGREPDENRYDFEFNPWTSRSFRVSFAPDDNWAMQYSYGFLKNPEELQPGDVRRMTASISYNKRFDRGNWATTLIWGRNRENHDEPQTLNGYTAESTVNFLNSNYVYTRLELVDKNSLLSHDEAHDLGFVTDHPVFRISAYTFGYARDVWTTDRFSIALGSDFTFYSKPAVLDAVYGNEPTSYHFFLRIRPSRMTHSGGGHGHP
jgi:hypothetical protein